MRKSIAGVAAAAVVGASAGAVAATFDQAADATIPTRSDARLAAGSTSWYRDALGPWTDWRVNSDPGTDGINLIAGGASADRCQPNAAFSQSTWLFEPIDRGTWKFAGHNGAIGEAQAYVGIYANNSSAQYRGANLGRDIDQAAWRGSWVSLGGGHINWYVHLSDRDYAAHNAGAQITSYDCMRIIF
jgi:hypothetical protein